MKSTPLFCFATQQYHADFPPLTQALRDPDGLLCAGGDLSAVRLLNAYAHGIFPWYSAGQPILWWSPDPRCVLFPQRVHVSRSLKRKFNSADYHLTLDRAFAAVLASCAGPRRDGGGTWLSADMRTAYLRLFTQGHAHSLECWQAGELVGGIYGVSIGCVFFGESMFSRARDASKICLVTLCLLLQRWGYTFMDTQVANAHTLSMGATQIPRVAFMRLLAQHLRRDPLAGAWSGV